MTSTCVGKRLVLDMTAEFALPYYKYSGAVHCGGFVLYVSYPSPKTHATQKFGKPHHSLTTALLKIKVRLERKRPIKIVLEMPRAHDKPYKTTHAMKRRMRHKNARWSDGHLQRSMACSLRCRMSFLPDFCYLKSNLLLLLNPKVQVVEKVQLCAQLFFYFCCLFFFLPAYKESHTSRYSCARNYD